MKMTVHCLNKLPDILCYYSRFHELIRLLLFIYATYQKHLPRFARNIFVYTQTWCCKPRLFYHLLFNQFFIENSDKIYSKYTLASDSSSTATNLQYSRSADTAPYVKPCTRTKFGDRGFRSAGLAACNSLPDELHRITDTDLNAVSKLYSSREHIVTNFISTPGRFCKWRYTNLYYYYYYYYYSCTTISLSIR